MVNCVLTWRLRRTLPNNSTTENKDTCDVVHLDSPRDQHVPQADSYMELRPRPMDEKSPEELNYEALQGENQTPVYYNVGFSKETKEEGDENVYVAIVGNSQ